MDRKNEDICASTKRIRSRLEDHGYTLQGIIGLIERDNLPLIDEAIDTYAELLGELTEQYGYLTMYREKLRREEYGE